MTLTRDTVLIATLVVSEAAWVYSLVSVFGVASDAGGSPLSYFALVGVTSISVVLHSRIRSLKYDAFVWGFIATTMVGLALVYLVVAVSVQPGSVVLDWAIRISDHLVPQGMVFRGVGGFVVGGLLWFRGIRIASVPWPERSLALSFRLGLVVIGVAAVFDIILEEQLDVLLLILVFFGAGLTGLNVAHLVPQSSVSAKAKTWPKTIGVTVSGVLGVGVMFGLMRPSALSFITSPAKSIFEDVATGIAIMIGVPLAIGMQLIAAGINALFGRDIDVTEFASQVGSFERSLGVGVEPAEPVTSTILAPERAQFAESPGWFAQFQDVLELGLLIVGFFVVAFTGYWLLKKATRSLRLGDHGERESVDDVRLPSDIGDLIRLALPSLKGKMSGKARAFGLPNGPPGVVEALRVYYQMLTTAEQNDVTRSEYLTPTEFKPTLGRVFPDEVVQPATEAFNRANYGNIESTDREIEDLRSSLRTLTAREKSAAAVADLGPPSATNLAPGQIRTSALMERSLIRDSFGMLIGLGIILGGVVTAVLVVVLIMIVF